MHLDTDFSKALETPLLPSRTTCFLGLQPILPRFPSSPPAAPSHPPSLITPLLCFLQMTACPLPPLPRLPATCLFLLISSSVGSSTWPQDGKTINTLYPHSCSLTGSIHSSHSLLDTCISVSIPKRRLETWSKSPHTISLSDSQLSSPQLCSYHQPPSCSGKKCTSQSWFLSLSTSHPPSNPADWNKQSKPQIHPFSYKFLLPKLWQQSPNMHSSSNLAPLQPFLYTSTQSNFLMWKWDHV